MAGGEFGHRFLVAVHGHRMRPLGGLQVFTVQVQTAPGVQHLRVSQSQLSEMGGKVHLRGQIRVDRFNPGRGGVVLLPGEVPAGIMTALVGAPVFVWLIRRGKGAGL